MTPILIPPPDAARGETKPRFNIVLAYADMDTALRGKRVHDGLVDELGTKCNFILRLWKFDVLKDAQVRAEAARDAATANMLIISAHSGRELPREVKLWVKTSLRKKETPATVVALLEGKDDPAAGPRSVRAYLCKQAVLYQMDFFSDERQTITLQQPPKPHHAEHPTYEHWGIND